MPYISANGEIAGNQPWGLSKIVSLFWGVLNFIYLLFATLINPGSHSQSDSQSSYRSGGGGAVSHVSGDSDLSVKLKSAGAKLVVIDFFATWCGPCRMIAPYLEEMATEMSDVVFLKVDVDECPDVAATYSVRSMPTLVFIKRSKKLDSFSGADLNKLRDLVYKYR